MSPSPLYLQSPNIPFHPDRQSYNFLAVRAPNDPMRPVHQGHNLLAVYLECVPVGLIILRVSFKHRSLLNLSCQPMPRAHLVTRALARYHTTPQSREVWINSVPTLESLSSPTGVQPTSELPPWIRLAQLGAFQCSTILFEFASPSYLLLLSIQTVIFSMIPITASAYTCGGTIQRERRNNLRPSQSLSEFQIFLIS